MKEDERVDAEHMKIDAVVIGDDIYSLAYASLIDTTQIKPAKGYLTKIEYSP